MVQIDEAADYYSTIIGGGSTKIFVVHICMVQCPCGRKNFETGVIDYYIAFCLSS